MVNGVNGETGLNVLQHVVMERKRESGYVIALHQIMEGKIVMETRLILKTVTTQIVQVYFHMILHVIVITLLDRLSLIVYLNLASSKVCFVLLY